MQIISVKTRGYRHKYHPTLLPIECRVSRICNFVEFHHGELTSPVVIKNKLPEKISEFSVKKWAVAGHFKFSKESAQKYKEKYGNLVFCILCCKLRGITDFAFLGQFVCSMRFFWYPYCYGLWHFMSYAICHKMAFYDILSGH